MFQRGIKSIVEFKVILIKSTLRLHYFLGFGIKDWHFYGRFIASISQFLTKGAVRMPISDFLNRARRGSFDFRYYGRH